MVDLADVTVELETDVYTFPQLRETVVYYRMKMSDSWSEWRVTRVAA